MKPAVALMLLLASLGAEAQEDCSLLEPDSVQASCLSTQQLEAADKSLNESYRDLLNGLSAESLAKSRPLLVEAQRAWIKFRDSHCALVGELNGGHPSWNGIAETQCKAKLTTQRAREIREIEM